jgi:hypothetical protein
MRAWNLSFVLYRPLIIADIPGDAERYKAGIFGYSHTATIGQTFIVVNYWVTE